MMDKQKRAGWKVMLPAGVLMSGLLLAGCGAADGGTDSAAAPKTQTPSQTGSTSAPAAGEAKGNADGSSAAAPTGNASGQSAAGGEQSAASTDSSKDLTVQREKSSLQSTIKQVKGKDVVTNPESMTVIVNKNRYLPEGYEPPDLVVPDVAFSYDGVLEKSHMRKEAAGALEELFKASKSAGLDLRAVSAYRSYKRQVSIYNNNVATKGKEYTDRVSARPGTSEHQTGLAIDVSGPGIGYGLEQSFGKTAEGKWLKQHAAEYGFVIRYKKGADDITGYTWEPWHIRYIGKALAEDVTAKDLTLEEYFDQGKIKQ
ncbi:M15 family metallopeptidase [Paenibacillus sp. Z6-24]